jgi:CelD/BcsL family acetyltransferase involved in cellulose biosynthesis
MTAGCVTQAKASTWIVKPIRLKFTLGGVMLTAVTRKAMVVDGYTADLSAESVDPRLLFERQPYDVACALINSRPIENPLPRVSFLGDYIRYVPRQYRRFHLDLQDTYAGYLKRLSQNRRQQLRRSLKAFAVASGGQTQWREYRQPGEMAEYHRLAREVSAKSYQEKLVDAGLPDNAEFLAEIIELARRGAIRGYILFFQGKPIAYDHCPIEGDAILYERTGYDPEFQNLRPGVTLLFLIIEHLFATRQFSRFDFGRGDYPYKETFSTGSVLCADIYHFRRTPANCALVFCHAAVERVSSAIASILQHLNLKDRLKKMVRSHYAKS